MLLWILCLGCNFTCHISCKAPTYSADLLVFQAEAYSNWKPVLRRHSALQYLLFVLTRTHGSRCAQRRLVAARQQQVGHAGWHNQPGPAAEPCINWDRVIRLDADEQAGSAAQPRATLHCSSSLTGRLYGYHMLMTFIQPHCKALRGFARLRAPGRRAQLYLKNCGDAVHETSLVISTPVITLLGSHPC